MHKGLLEVIVYLLFLLYVCIVMHRTKEIACNVNSSHC